MELEVWLDRRLVGHLLHEGATHRFAFRYTPDWLAEPRRYPLSPRIPLERPLGQSDEQHSAEMRQFFENLLPEGDALDHAAQANGVSKANLVALLIALGRETAGALRIALPGTLPRADAGHERRLLTPDELSQRIRERAQQPFSVWDGRVRLSIAGYQDKIDQRLAGAPRSTHVRRLRERWVHPWPSTGGRQYWRRREPRAIGKFLHSPWVELRIERGLKLK